MNRDGTSHNSKMRKDKKYDGFVLFKPVSVHVMYRVHNISSKRSIVQKFKFHYHVSLKLEKFMQLTY